MDWAFISAVTVGVGFLSGMICVRLLAGGAPRRRIAGLLVELWMVFAVWMIAFRVLGSAVGEPVGLAEGAGLADLSNRLSGVKAAIWSLFGAGAGLGLATCLHLLVGLRRAMSQYGLEATGGER